MYAEHFEWINHSMSPQETEEERKLIGEKNPAVKQPYAASLLNVSAMSYGSLSPNAILALSRGAHLGGFYHNTGEVSSEVTWSEVK